MVPPVANFKEIDPELGALNLSRGGSYPVHYALRLGAGFGSQISMSLVRWVPSSDGRRPVPRRLRLFRAQRDRPQRSLAIGAESRPRYLGATNLIELDLGEAGRLLARPSGTEPKLKVYVDLKGPFPESGDWIGAEADLASTAVAAGEALAGWLTERMGG